jgi:hypothetical protein
MPMNEVRRDTRRPMHSERCMCARCRGRRHQLERDARVQPRVLVDSDTVAAHIERLLVSGWKRIEIARAAGLSPALVTKAARPGNGLNASSAEKILALGEAGQRQLA